MRQISRDKAQSQESAANVRLILKEYAAGSKKLRDGAEVLREGVDHYVRAGQLLIVEREKRGHGDWQFYCETHFPDIGKTRIWQLMKLAERKSLQENDHSFTGEQMTSAMQTLKQAFLTAGIIKPTLPAGEESHHAIDLTASLTDGIGVEMLALYCRRWIQSVYAPRKHEATRTDLEFWMHHLKPIAQVCDEIEARLGDMKA